MSYIVDWFAKQGLTLTSPFGKRPSLGDFHTGLDFGGKRGTPILNPWPGVVVNAGFDNSARGYGHYIGIEMIDGHIQGFAHMDDRLVKKGQYVERGEVVGPLGMTGFCTGPHLHYFINKPGGGVRGANYWGDPQLFKFGGERMELKDLINIQPTPETFSHDISKVQIFSQGDPNSCIAAAICYNRETLKGKPFSVGFTYGLREEEDVGWTIHIALKNLQKYGAVELRHFSKYMGHPEIGQAVEAEKPRLLPLAVKHRIAGYAECHGNEEIKAAIHQLGPVVAVIPNNTWGIDSKGYLYPVDYPHILGFHAVCVVGWTKTHWIALNSHGPEFGDNGKFYIPIDGKSPASKHPSWLLEVWALADKVKGGDRVEKLIVIFGEGDRGMGSLVEYIEKAPVIERINAPKSLLDSVETLYQIGGTKKIECGAKKIIHLAGNNRLETAEAVIRYLKGK